MTEGQGILDTRRSSRIAAVVLAAGAGTRLGDLGRRYSKPMVPVNGRPLIDWVLARLQAAGVARMIVVRHVADAELAVFMRANHRHVELVTQSERRGIADALHLALPLLASEPGYLACACDSLFDPDDIARLVALGQTHAESAAVGVLDMGPDATVSRSTVRLDGDRVLEIVEKPPRTALVSGIVAMPLYWLPRRAAVHIERVAPLGGESYVSTALNDFIQAGGVVRAVPMRGRLEITTAKDVTRAEAELKSGPPSTASRYPQSV